MNKKIRDFEKQINQKKFEIAKLKKEILKESMSFYKRKGITPGTLVEIEREHWNGPGDTYWQKGIFTHTIYEYGVPKAVLRKVKKDGTAHATAKLYVFGTEKIRKVKE